MPRTPLALFTYNRADHTKLLLQSLERCARLDECLVHIYCDGPKNDGQALACEESRAVVRQWASVRNAKVVEREQNLGLARSIVTGVTDLCNKYGRVIVLEDDLIVGPDFLEYMIEALDKYEHEDSVYQVSGFMFPCELRNHTDSFFLPLTTTWGWATWKRAWESFDWHASGAMNQLSDEYTKRRFDADSAYPYSVMLKKRMSGQNDSWGILWYFSVFKNDGLVLYPPRSLVWVGGFDSSGTHCGDSSMEQRSLAEIQSSRDSQRLMGANIVECNQNVLSVVQRYLRCQTRWMRLRSMPRRLVSGVRSAMSIGRKLDHD